MSGQAGAAGMTALYHDHVRPDGAEGGNLLRRAARPVTHSRGYDTSALAGRGGLLTIPTTRPDRVATRSGHFEPRRFEFLGEPPSRTAGRRSRIVTWALPQTGPRARPLDAGYFRQGLVPAISFRRGWGCSPARLAEFRARLAAGLRQEQVDALLSDPVDHLPCRDTDLPERHMPKPFKNSRLERHHHSRTRVANAQFPVGETRHV